MDTTAHKPNGDTARPCICLIENVAMYGHRTECPRAVEDEPGRQAPARIVQARRRPGDRSF